MSKPTPMRIVRPDGTLHPYLERKTDAPEHGTLHPIPRSRKLERMVVLGLLAFWAIVGIGAFMTLRGQP
ncbi:MAG: hypothetical protein KGL42_17865 [Betaproteobacteria bacterium]|nr:hypothetical protein [Betaproteobacteria bacterium]